MFETFWFKWNLRHNTITVNMLKAKPKMTPASTSHQWCLLSPILVNEHITAHMDIIHCNHGFRRNVRSGKRRCKYHCDKKIYLKIWKRCTKYHCINIRTTRKVVVNMETAEWPDGNDLLESETNHSEFFVFVHVYFSTYLKWNAKLY